VFPMQNRARSWVACTRRLLISAAIKAHREGGGDDGESGGHAAGAQSQVEGRAAERCAEHLAAHKQRHLPGEHPPCAACGIILRNDWQEPCCFVVHGWQKGVAATPQACSASSVGTAPQQPLAQQAAAGLDNTAAVHSDCPDRDSLLQAAAAHPGCHWERGTGRAGWRRSTAQHCRWRAARRWEAGRRSWSTLSLMRSPPPPG